MCEVKCALPAVHEVGQSGGVDRKQRGDMQCVGIEGDIEG